MLENTLLNISRENTNTGLELGTVVDTRSLLLRDQTLTEHFLHHSQRTSCCFSCNNVQSLQHFNVPVGHSCCYTSFFKKVQSNQTNRQHKNSWLVFHKFDEDYVDLLQLGKSALSVRTPNRFNMNFFKNLWTIFFRLHGISLNSWTICIL